jgi:hypothetical protein
MSGCDLDNTAKIITPGGATLRAFQEKIKVSRLEIWDNRACEADEIDAKLGTKYDKRTNWYSKKKAVRPPVISGNPGNQPLA